MYRVLIAECKQEVSSFNPVPSRYDDFTIAFGDALLAQHQGVQSEIAGVLGVLGARADLRVIPTYGAAQRTSGGRLAAADFARLAGEFLAGIRAAPEVDAAYFALHGAMSAEGEDDPEGFLLAEARKFLGERIPIVASFDLHGILTDRMLEHCDAIVIYHTYPHVDFVETGARAARLLLRLLAGQARPVTARVAIPALVRGDELITETGLFGRFIREAQAIEQSASGLSAGMFIGNPFTDVLDLCSNAVVVTDDDPAGAERAARQMAEGFWELRQRLQQPLTALADAARIACDSPGTTILVDAADATSSGASGDSNAILRALLDAGYRGRALVPIVDAPAVRMAFAAGVGQIIRVSVGGTLDPGRFAPLPVEARVHLLAEGRFRNESWGSQWDAGPTAVLHVGSNTLVATSRPVHLFDRSLFLAHGQNPQYFDAVVVKSPHCQHQFYQDWAARMIHVDAPGATSANLRSLGHTRCRRPIFPLDEGVTFTAEA
ncbi:MAG TPA: M81 family metallopeptidase, partial [Roseiflexaceae bacterium]|nr:M81 family metallopeptidase [Roseiflexaceae bacterium]